MSIDLAGGVRGISIKQPWLSAIVDGPKRTENRPRRWPPGTYMLHGSQRWDDNGTWDHNVMQWLLGLTGALPVDYLPPRQQDARRRRFPIGAVTAIAEVVECHPAVGCCAPWGIAEGFHLTLGEVVKLPEPVECRGTLGPWRRPEVLAKVRAQLTGVAS